MLEAEFFYRNPLENNEAKPAFGLEEPDPNNERPNHTGFIKKISNGREENHTLDTSGFSLILCPTKVKDFYNDEEVSSIYYPEMHELVKKETGANQVQIISHITRNEEEAAQGKRLGAHRLVHNDFTPQFQSIVDEFLKEAKNKPSRVVVYNLWRRFDKDGLDAPFAVCDATSVSNKELIPTDLHNYGGGQGFAVEIYQSEHNEKHRWCYYPKMTRDEALMFKTYDSAADPFIPTLHSAFDDPSLAGKKVTPRESIEVRAICFFN